MNINIRTIDGAVFSLPVNQAQRSAVLKQMLETFDITDPEDERLKEPLPITVSTKAFEKIMIWLASIEGKAPRVIDPERPRFALTREEMAFCSGMTTAEAMDLLHGANFLDIQELIEIIAQHIANSLSDKSVDQMRAMLGLEDDMSPQEKRAIRERFNWVDPSSE